jgi:uncharacterized protein (DUF2344 family)
MKIVYVKKNVKKNYRTTFRILNTAEYHVESLREQVKALKQQTRRIKERLVQKTKKKLKKYEQEAVDEKNKQTINGGGIIQTTCKRHFHHCNCSCDKNVC